MATIILTPGTLSAIRANINNSRPRSAWSKGVNAYALDILEDLSDRAAWCFENYGTFPALSEAFALNGANDWNDYAAGGCGLAYTSAILERLCTASELRRLNRSSRSDIDAIKLEGRALFQAWRVIVLSCSLLS